MPPRIALALVLHNHQPVGNFGWVFEEVYRRAYEPMVGALERHPAVRVGLHYTGPLLTWFRAEHAELIDRIRALVDRRQVELLGGGYYEPILASLPEADRHGQLVRMAAEMEALFGRRPRGAWLAERVWEPSVPYDLAGAGYEWTVLDDNHLRAASVKEDAMWGAYTTDDQGRRLTIFGTEQGLRYRIPFGGVEDLIGYLREHATERGERVGMMGDDGEKFGSWPGTFEHCWGEGRWVDRCFEALDANGDWLRTVTPSEWLDRDQPIRRIYVPTSSYVEMTEWALPADESNLFHELLARAREERRPEARFLRGGMWRDFQARYREVNDLHKQMLRVSAKVAAMPDGEAKQRALDHLYQGQSNDCYWHGLFGGIYIVHMRMATLGHLIAAEDIADTERHARDGGGGDDCVVVRVEDFDLDGLPDLLLEAPDQTVLIDLDEGGGISSWDLRASRVALASVMRRRREAYHEKLVRHEREGGEDDGGGDAPRTIHEIVKVKEPGLADRLQYDRHERRGGLVHLLAPEEAMPGPDASDLAAGRYRELGDFVDSPFELVEPISRGGVSDEALDPVDHAVGLGPAAVRLGRGPVVLRRHGGLEGPHGERAVSVTKRIALGGHRLDPSLSFEATVENRSGEDLAGFELGLEWSFNMMGGGGNPAAYYERTSGDGDVPLRTRHDASGELAETGHVAFGNTDAGVRIEVELEPSARCTWFPVETVSNSEDGFERAYQGSALWFRWRVEVLRADAQTFTVRFRTRQDRDLSLARAEPDRITPARDH